MSVNSIVTARLDAAIRAVCPILGVAISANNAGSFQADPSATAAQIAAASAALAAFDWSAAADAAWWTAQLRGNAVSNLGTAVPGLSVPEYIVLRALVLTLVDSLNTIRASLPTPLPSITAAQAKAAIQAHITSGSADT